MSALAGARLLKGHFSPANASRYRMMVQLAAIAGRPRPVSYAKIGSKDGFLLPDINANIPFS